MSVVKFSTSRKRRRDFLHGVNAASPTRLPNKSLISPQSSHREEPPSMPLPRRRGTPGKAFSRGSRGPRIKLSNKITQKQSGPCWHGPDSPWSTCARLAGRFRALRVTLLRALRVPPAAAFLEKASLHPGLVQGKQKSRLLLQGAAGKGLAERQGFEPWLPCGKQHFQCCSIDHSDTSPCVKRG